MKYIAIFLVCITVLPTSFFASSCNNAEVHHKKQIGKDVDVSLVDLSGKPVDIQLYKGKAIFINFWATWCRPCIEEMPSIERLSATLQKDPVVFLLASSEEARDILQFVNENHLTLEIVRVINAEEVNIHSLPTTFIYDSNHQLVFSEAGVRQWNSQENVEMLRKIISQ